MIIRKTNKITVTMTHVRNLRSRINSTRRTGITIVHDWIKTGKHRLINTLTPRLETTELYRYLLLSYFPSRSPLNVNCLDIVHLQTGDTCRSLVAKCLRRISIGALRSLHATIQVCQCWNNLATSSTSLLTASPTSSRNVSLAWLIPTVNWFV